MVGATRSGSTILGNALGSAGSCIHVGELQAIWHSGLAVDFLCGCGVRVRQCEFWTAVVERAFGRFGVYEAMETHLWKMRLYEAVQDRVLEGEQDLRERYLGRLGRLYDSIAAESGCSILVDSSKRTDHADLVAGLSGAPVYYLHLVRDPRGCYLSVKTRIRRDDTPQRVVIHRTDPAREAKAWNRWHLSAEECCRRGPSQRVLYEEFADRPGEVLGRLFDFVGLEDGRPEILEGPSLDLAVSHNIVGNPKKFQQQGLTTIRPDRRWQQELTQEEDETILAHTQETLARYGYDTDSRPG